MSRQEYDLGNVIGDYSPDILGNKMETFGLLNDESRPTSNAASPNLSVAGTAVATTSSSTRASTSTSTSTSTSGRLQKDQTSNMQKNQNSMQNVHNNNKDARKLGGIDSKFGGMDDELDLISTSTSMKNSSQGPELTMRLLAACLFQLPMGMIWSTIGLIVLPFEAEQFYPKAHSGFLGLLLTIAGTSQIISPIVGKMSDRHRSVFGRRRPFMIYGTILTGLGVLGLSYTSANRIIVWYAVFLFVSQVGLNMIYSATVLGLVPDTLEAQGESDRAAASGTIAIFQFLGNLIGMLFMMSTSGSHIRVVYPAYLVSVLLTAAVVWVSCPEDSSLYMIIPSESASDELYHDKHHDHNRKHDKHDDQELNSPDASTSPNSDNGLLMNTSDASERAAGFGGYNIGYSVGHAAKTQGAKNSSSLRNNNGGRNSVTTIHTSKKVNSALGEAWKMLRKQLELFDATKEADFFWVFVGRTMYYLSMSCLSFIFYYVRDIGGIEEESKRKYSVAMIVVMAQATGALTAYPAGKLSDKVGRKKLIYASCCLMSVMFFWYLVIPFVKVEGQAPLFALILGSCIYGVATGCYMAVDYALAIDCLPDKNSKGASEALGLWGISGFIGSYIGPMGGGALLEFFGSTGMKEHYSYPGYVALLSTGACMCLASAYVTSFIKKSR